MTRARLITWLAGYHCRRRGHRWIEHFTGWRRMLARCCPDCGCGEIKIANSGGHDATHGGGPSAERGEDCPHRLPIAEAEAAQKGEG